jgi:2-phospho-L-lactate transferase/gluconeogenesis factor (CofD/UPF0052 family)
MLNVVVINGGRGAASLIPALLDREGLNVTSVVNAYDDGKSTGEIRRFFDMLGPSDIRKVQQLMLPTTDPHHDVHSQLYEFRYVSGQDRHGILDDMKTFASGSGTLAGIDLQSSPARKMLQTYISEFIRSLELIERARGKLFNFDDCSLMNCLFAGANLVHDRDFEVATLKMDRLFRLKGTVLPNSTENRQLAAIRQNGEVLYSEAEIVELRSNVLIDRVYLLTTPIPHASLDRLNHSERRYFLDKHHASARVSEGVRRAIGQADIIVYAAGTQHSSLYPTYLSSGFGEVVAANRSATKIFVTNIGADYETPSYTAIDFIKGAHRYICLGDGREYPTEQLFSAVLVNTGRHKGEETYVDFDPSTFEHLGVRLVTEDFEDHRSPGKHDGTKVGSAILDLYEQGR